MLLRNMDPVIPVQQKYFFRILPFCFVWNHYTGGIGRAQLALHTTPTLSEGEPYYTHAGNVKPGETLGEKLQNELQQAFGMQVYAVAGIHDDGVGHDRAGNTIPRVAVDVQVEYFSCANRRVGDLYMSWVPPKAPLAPETAQLIFPDFETNHARLHGLLHDLGEDTPLDYTEVSLQRLENIVDSLNAQLTSALLGNTVVYMGSIMTGCILKRYGGNVYAARFPWVRVQDSKAHYYIVRPFVKAQNRLARGREESLVHYGELLQKLV